MWQRCAIKLNLSYVVYVPRFLACNIPVSCLCPADGFSLARLLPVNDVLLPVLSCRRLFGNSQFRYLSSSLRTSSLHVRYSHAEFATSPNRVRYQSRICYHTNILPSSSDQHLVYDTKPRRPRACDEIVPVMVPAQWNSGIFT